MAHNQASPGSKRKKAVHPRGRAPAFKAVEVGDIIDSFNHKHQIRDRAIFMVSFFMGLRAKEIAGLKLGDVLHPSGELKTDVMLRAETTKGFKTREAYIEHSELRRYLSDYLEHRERQGRFTLDAPLFMSQKGGHFSPGTMQKLFARLYARAGYRGSSHSGRRSFATRLNERGVDVRSIQVLMGHADISTTQVYIETSPDRLRKFVKML